MNRYRPSRSTERVAISWVVAGLALLTLVGLSFSIEDPVIGGTQEIPVYAIDEDLVPVQSGALEMQDQYAAFVVPASFEPEQFRTGVAP